MNGSIWRAVKRSVMKCNGRCARSFPIDRVTDGSDHSRAGGQKSGQRCLTKACRILVWGLFIMAWTILLIFHPFQITMCFQFSGSSLETTLFMLRGGSAPCTESRECLRHSLSSFVYKYSDNCFHCLPTRLLQQRSSLPHSMLSKVRSGLQYIRHSAATQSRHHADLQRSAEVQIPLKLLSTHKAPLKHLPRPPMPLRAAPGMGPLVTGPFPSLFYCFYGNIVENGSMEERKVPQNSLCQQ